MTNKLILNKTEDTPEIILDAESAVFSFKGKSLPENAVEFYCQILHWFESYSENPLSTTHFNFHFEYFNTSSAKQIFKIFSLIKKLEGKTQLIIDWRYDDGDKDMKASGERFAKLCELKISVIPA